MTLKDDFKELDKRVVRLENERILKQHGWTKDVEHWLPPKDIAKVFDWEIGYRMESAMNIHEILWWAKKY